MADFATTVARIAGELRRSNITSDIKSAINDAIAEASNTRYYFNEMRGISFNTVADQEYYSDQGLVGIDAVWFMTGATRRNIYLNSNLIADRFADGNISGGQLESYSRQGTDIRLYPIPKTVFTVYMEGYGKLTPSPLVNDGDTNNWLVHGEPYIRALAKRNILRDVIRDFAEAAVYDSVATDYENMLASVTAERIGTGDIKPTQW